MRSADWDRAYASCELEWTVEPHPYVERELAGLEPGQVVELGCGEGRQAIWLAGRGWRVTAVDFSPVAVDRARSLADRHGAEVDWMVADVLAYHPPVPVDLAMILYLHIDPDDFARVLGRLAAALTPGGTLFVLGWDRSSVGGPPGGYSLDGLVSAVDELRVVRAEQVPQVGSLDAVDTLLVAACRRSRPE